MRSYMGVWIQMTFINNIYTLLICFRYKTAGILYTVSLSLSVSLSQYMARTIHVFIHYILN